LANTKLDGIMAFLYRCVAELTAGTVRSRVTAENGFCISVQKLWRKESKRTRTPL